jgi:hypothetical protein
VGSGLFRIFIYQREPGTLLREEIEGSGIRSAKYVHGLICPSYRVASRSAKRNSQATSRPRQSPGMVSSAALECDVNR